MPEIAALSLEVKSDQVTQATAALRELPKAASAAERAAEKWSNTTKEAARSSEDFSRRVRKTIADLEFERQQLARSATDRARYSALRRAGVAEASAEGQAILASVRALQAQRAALGQTSIATKAYGAAWGQVKSLLVGFSIVGIVAGLTSVAKQSMEAVAGLDELAEQLGVTTTFLQASQLSATQNGVKIEQLETAYSKFSQKMGEAAEGSKEMVEALDKLGIKNLDAQGKLRPTEALMQEVAAALLKIEDPARRSAAAVDFFGKAGTRMLPMLNDLASGSAEMAAAATRAGTMIEADVIKQLDKMSDSAAKTGLQVRALFAEFGAPIVTTSLEKVSGLIGEIIGQLDRGRASGQGFWATILQDSRTQGRMGGLRLSTPEEEAADQLEALKKQLTSPAAEGREQAILDDIAKLERTRLAERQASMASEEDWARRFKLPAMSPVAGDKGGASLSAVKGAGKEAEDAEKKYAKLIEQLDLAVAAQDNMTAASMRGEVAFESMKVHLEAQQKALDIYGKALDDTDPRLKKIEERMLRISQGKAAEAFNVATTELEKQNVILAKQIELMNEAPEIQAREIAMIKVKQDAEKAGTAVTTEMIEARRKAIEQNETLKNQQEELRKAQELWTAPLKSALESIQQTAADAFENMLQNGRFSFEELGKVFKSIITRMIAEFMALSTIRPVMNVIVNAIGGSGMANQMGLGGSSGGGLGSLFGGGGASGGGMQLPSFMGGGSISDFFGQTLYGGSPIFGPVQPGAAPLGSAGGISLGGALGGLAGIGMGAYSLMNSRSTAGTIGGIGQMVGGGMMLIPGMQIPGMIVSVLSSILPSLFGEGDSRTHSSTNASLRYGAGGYYTTGGAWGSGANSGQSEKTLGQIGSTLTDVFSLFGEVKDASKVWGLNLSTWTAQGKDWSYTSQASHLIDPNGNQVAWRMNMDDMLSTGSAQVALRSILDGAVGEISENMRKALTDLSRVAFDAVPTIEQLGQSIAEIIAYDDAIGALGDTASDAAKATREALKQIDASFAGLYATAEKFGFSTETLDAAKQAERLKYATGFADSIQRGINDFSDPTINKLADLDKWRLDAIATNEEILKSVTGALDQINNIEEYYALQRQQIIEDGNKRANSAVIASIDELIRSLRPGGALANVDPRSQLAGLEATYRSTYAQASAGDEAARARFASDASAYAQFSQSFYGGSTEYNRIRDSLIRDAQTLQGSIGSGMLTGANQNTAALNTNVQQLVTAMQESRGDDTALRGDIARLIGLLERYVANAA